MTNDELVSTTDTHISVFFLKYSYEICCSSVCWWFLGSFIKKYLLCIYYWPNLHFVAL